jgi:hypothetical protein
MDKGRGDLCCTAVSNSLWTIDLPRPPYHKILLDAGDSAAFSSIFPWTVRQGRLASSFLCSQAESTPTPTPFFANAFRWAAVMEEKELLT